MHRQIPNIITIARLVLAVVFFAILSGYQYHGRGDPWLLNAAFIVYLIALISDFLDGYLARRWNADTQFGRMIDPFVDKVLVLGSFIFFAGKNFVVPESQGAMVVKTITGVAPGIVVILLARELLVTSLRALSEGEGHDFGAAFSGKVKMVCQSVTILVILLYVNWLHSLEHSGYAAGARYFRDFCIWVTVAVTIVSGLLYIHRALRPALRAAKASGVT
jgi:CDP-diacylglycerol---glycerol-3-phosphate 3-phosphatidyltransferase